MFGHSQTACRGQLTCSRCASVGHASSDCSLEMKCVNCSQAHSVDSKLCPKCKTEKEIQTLKTNKKISYLEARKLIGSQPSFSFHIVVYPSGKPFAFRTSIKPTTQIQSRLPGPISASAPENSLNTSTSSLSTETCPAPTTSNKFAALQPSEPLLESATTSNSELSKTSKIPQNVKMYSKNRRKRTKAQKAEIEIKMAKHKPRKSGPTELTTDDEDMIMHECAGGGTRARS
ncbi:uncharacterized protein TNCV_934181 [Trichonephila clavipes]|nr:uncharacterized protein TNCV_934181 [Trichonephila clavipes]